MMTPKVIDTSEERNRYIHQLPFFPHLQKQSSVSNITFKMTQRSALCISRLPAGSRDAALRGSRGLDDNAAVTRYHDNYSSLEHSRIAAGMRKRAGWVFCTALLGKHRIKSDLKPFHRKQLRLRHSDVSIINLNLERCTQRERLIFFLGTLKKFQALIMSCHPQ